MLNHLAVLHWGQVKAPNILMVGIGSARGSINPTSPDCRSEINNVLVMRFPDSKEEIIDTKGKQNASYWE